MLQSLRQQMIEFLEEEEGFEFEENSSLLEATDLEVGETVFYIQHAEENQEILEGILSVDFENRTMLFATFMPGNVPKEYLKAISEFTTRFNYGLIFGTLELDFDDGEVRFKTTMDADNAEVSYEMIDNMLSINLDTMRVLAPLMDRITNNELSPLEASDQMTEFYSYLDEEGKKNEN